MALESSLSVFIIVLLFVANKEEASKNNKILLTTVIVFITSLFSNISLGLFLVLLEDGAEV